MIRKISFGVDYKDAMHYTKGQPIGRMTIYLIKKIADKTYDIFVEDEDKNVFVWKTIENMPVVVEYDIKSF